MLSRKSYSDTNIAYHKSDGFTHNISLFNQALQSTYVDQVELINTAKFTASKAVIMIHLNQNADVESFEITDCNAETSSDIYPNGIILIHFENIHLKAGENIECSYRFRLKNKAVDKSKIVKKTYLFFFQ